MKNLKKGLLDVFVSALIARNVGLILVSSLAESGQEKTCLAWKTKLKQYKFVLDEN